MRLRSDVFVSAYIRRRNSENAFAVVRRKGAPEAGAIFIVIDRLNGHRDLYGPAPQSEVTGEGVDRLFMALNPAKTTHQEVEDRLAREIRFDPDCWIVEVEDREGHACLDLAAV